MQVADDFAHLRGQVPGGVRGQRLLRLVQLYDGQVGQVDEVVDRRRLDGDVLVGHQAVAVDVARGGDDIDGEARRIDVQVVGVERQFAPVVVNRHPPPVHQHEGEAGHESALQAAAQDFRRVGLHAVHPVVPALLRQSVAHKYRQVFIQRVHLGNLQFKISFSRFAW